MAELPPKWVMENYAKLWTKFKENPFSNTEAKKIVGNFTNPSIIYSKLKTTGWLRITLDPKDSRKSVYSLKNPHQAIDEYINEKQ